MGSHLDDRITVPSLQKQIHGGVKRDHRDEPWFSPRHHFGQWSPGSGRNSGRLACLE